MDDVETELEALLENWRAGRASRTDLYLAVRAPMRQAARRGIGMITSSDPDTQGIEDVVWDAFLELERQDRATVRSVAGLAWRIAYRRGQDAGRRLIRRREQIHLLTDRAVTSEIEFREEDVHAAACQEVLLDHLQDCMEALTDEQRDVIRATVMGRENVSNWAVRTSKTHQAASAQRRRAIESLRRCVELKRNRPTTGGH